MICSALKDARPRPPLDFKKCGQQFDVQLNSAAPKTSNDHLRHLNHTFHTETIHPCITYPKHLEIRMAIIIATLHCNDGPGELISDSL
jgi:hypothetical protein